MTVSAPIPLKPDDIVVRDMTCTICLEIAFESPVITTACEHVFCKTCVEQWIRSSSQQRRGEAVPIGVCPNERFPLSTRELEPLSGVVRRMWEQIAVKCPTKECTWSGTLGNFGTHADRCHQAMSLSSSASLMEAKNACLEKDVAELEAIVTRTLRMNVNSTTTATRTLPSTCTNFYLPQTYYDSFRVVELALLICRYLKYKPDATSQNFIFHCVQNCYNCYKRPDPLAEYDEFHNRLKYHKVLQLLLGACIESTWFTYKQERSFKFWVRYINGNDI